MKHRATRDLFEYWNDLRGGRAAPERNDVDPGAIRHILADTFMLDIDAERHFPFRLTGTRVNALFDAEQKGRSFLKLWRPEETRNIAGLLLTVADNACPVVAGAVGAPPHHDECAFELLFLPMRHHGKTHSRVLGMIKTVKDPAWLGLLPIGPLKLRSLRIVEGDELRPAHADPIQVPRTVPPPLRTSLIQPDIRAHLRVIEGGAPHAFGMARTGVLGRRPDADFSDKGPR